MASSTAPETALGNEKVVSQVEQLRKMAQEEGAGMWESAWRNNITPWDANGVQAGLKEIVEEDGDKWGMLPRGMGRAVVPGCGKGYDVCYFAQRMEQAWGIDISETAVNAAIKWVAEQPDPPSNIHFAATDFFKFIVPEGGFDLGYDYTFFCALDPSMYNDWAKRYSQIIRPGGKLITLIFPIDGDRTTGPPFSVNPDKMKDLLETNSFKQLIYKKPHQQRKPGIEMLAVWERLP